MFAGAAREAVFSKPEVVQRVNADFVPVALNVALLGDPPDDEEGRLYREINRSNPAQGICVVNSAGKVLNWVLMFDDDKSVLDFLDHAQKRFAQYPDAKQRVAAERYMKFPSFKVDDVQDTAKAPLVTEGHAEGKSCPAKARLPRGTVVARVFGRALDKDGKPVADTVRQEHYVEDRFYVPVAMQEDLAKALADAGDKRFRMPDNLARLLVSHAYLGQLDVNPLGSPGGQGSLKQCEFWAQKVEVEGGKVPAQIRLEGRSEAAGRSFDRDVGDGRLWQHDVKLVWEGLIEVQEGRMTRLLLLARGSEKLKWDNQDEEFKGKSDVARLLLGHPIDLACEARFGFIGESIGANEAAAEASPQR